MLVVQRNATVALQVCHRAYVLEAGRVVLHDSVANLMRNAKVKEA